MRKQGNGAVVCRNRLSYFLVQWDNDCCAPIIQKVLQLAAFHPKGYQYFRELCRGEFERLGEQLVNSSRFAARCSPNSLCNLAPQLLSLGKCHYIWMIPCTSWRSQMSSELYEVKHRIV